MFEFLERYRNSPAHKYINSPQLEEDLMEAAKKMTIKEAIAEFKERLAITDYKELIPEYYVAMELAIEALEKQVTGDWIPCSERLPDDGICVLVTVNGQHNNITFVDALQMGLFSGDEGWIIDGFEDWTTPDAIAWMPLPEPYKGAENET